MTNPTSVLLVEDSPVALEILERLLSSSPDIKVVGKARNGKEALDLIPKLQPKVICTDLHMKGMDGLEFTKHVMANDPRPILVVSTSVQKEDTHTIFELLQAGAVDVFPKPSTGLASDYEQVKRDLIGKIKILSGVTVFTKRQQPSVKAVEVNPSMSAIANVTRSLRVITIGASTGGPQAIHKILAQFPAEFPVPIICTQHISQGFLQGLVDWLDSECKVKVKVAQVGESPLPGTVYFAPDNSHLELDAQGKFIYSSALPVDGHCPSVTVTFKSVAKFYGRSAAGILLTGMGRDGAEGMRAIAQVGGMTFAQDEKTCIVFGMPKEAIALNVVQQVLPIQEIAPLLLRKVGINRI
ncbi:chemotaxis-specific protein-glutamate methyltransferase CheB [Aliterella atlantica]|uniref:Protein-glutamate methylesterase/protein-glutamine glutaminase n=1 Tax=Aliterella atlantica CENA595 TaxID=1618023 RepID=A0A0D8ZVW8_9CYAN|nr:chemotaxis-specific protein-glutamate methyltransferase CheB [Aliterella atlantica]KJH71366.1 chemotaxis protein [Aliterella atlantica CENA595]